MRAWLFSAGRITTFRPLMTESRAFRRDYRVSLTCVLLERPSGLVLVDTGWGTPTVRSPRAYPGLLFDLTAGAAAATLEATALGRVKALGFAAEDVADIVLTHMDIDHVGGLVDFPRARVHLSRAEHAATFHRRQPLRTRLHDNRAAF